MSEAPTRWPDDDTDRPILPVPIVIDEIHELCGGCVVGTNAARAAARLVAELVERGRASRITLDTITAIPDNRSSITEKGGGDPR